MAIGQHQPVVTQDDRERFGADEPIVFDDHVLQDRGAVPLAQHTNGLSVGRLHRAAEGQIWLPVARRELEPRRVRQPRLQRAPEMPRGGLVETDVRGLSVEDDSTMEIEHRDRRSEHRVLLRECLKHVGDVFSLRQYPCARGTAQVFGERRHFRLGADDVRRGSHEGVQTKCGLRGCRKERLIGRACQRAARDGQECEQHFGPQPNTQWDLVTYFDRRASRRTAASACFAMMSSVARIPCWPVIILPSSIAKRSTRLGHTGRCGSVPMRLLMASSVTPKWRVVPIPTRALALIRGSSKLLRRTGLAPPPSRLARVVTSELVAHCIRIQPASGLLLYAESPRY